MSSESCVINRYYLSASVHVQILQWCLDLHTHLAKMYVTLLMGGGGGGGGGGEGASAPLAPLRYNPGSRELARAIVLQGWLHKFKEEGVQRSHVPL